VVHGSEVTLFLTFIVALALTRHAATPTPTSSDPSDTYPPRKRGALRPLPKNQGVPVVSDETNTQPASSSSPESATLDPHHRLATPDRLCPRRTGNRPLDKDRVKARTRQGQGQGQGGGNRRRRVDVVEAKVAKASRRPTTQPEPYL